MGFYLALNPISPYLTCMLINVVTANSRTVAMQEIKDSPSYVVQSPLQSQVKSSQHQLLARCACVYTYNGRAFYTYGHCVPPTDSPTRVHRHRLVCFIPR